VTVNPVKIANAGFNQAERPSWCLTNIVAALDAKAMNTRR